MTGMALAARRREELGLPRVSDREAARRLLDNRARSARRLRAAARARGVATAALGTLSSPTRLNQWASAWGHSSHVPWPCRPGPFDTAGLACPALPALGASPVRARHSGILAALSTPSRPHFVALSRPSVPRLLTLARPSRIRLPAPLSCCVRRHSLAWAKVPARPSPYSTLTSATTSSLTSEAPTARSQISAQSPASQDRPLQH